MPVYMEIEGVRGDVPSNRSGGMNVLMADGSVKFLKHSINRTGGVYTVTFGGGLGAGVRVPTAGSGYGGATQVTAGVLDIRAVEVLKLAAPNLPLGFDSVQSREAGAAIRARALFNAARGFGLTGGIVVSISRVSGFGLLKQIPILSHHRIPAVTFLVHDHGNPNGVMMTLRNATISSPTIYLEYIILTVNGGQTSADREAQAPSVSEIVVTKSNDV